MGKTTELKVGHKLVKVMKWRRGVCQWVKPSSCTTRAISKLFKWAHSLKYGTKDMCFVKNNSGHILVGQERDEPKHSVSVPKGHLAVYVGDKEDDTCRVLVPVIYFNHPLFGELLREAEKVHGFNHPGGIQIPCRKFEFENVQMKIAAAASGGDRFCRRRSGRDKYS
ncbi:SAUR-like auxin-responsive protein family [Abeliophyllum distichum]|uniref:SAUR-like auxin-responsive protein family n=1 Tax=Abeliophyllum distichum TaxID=126358 RepID=A0ABD1Q8C4_9LAMI